MGGRHRGGPVVVMLSVPPAYRHLLVRQLPARPASLRETCILCCVAGCRGGLQSSRGIAELHGRGGCACREELQGRSMPVFDDGQTRLAVIRSRGGTMRKGPLLGVPQC